MKQWLKEYLGYRQNSIAICMTVLAAITLYVVLFAGPRPGCVDMGEYDQTLYRMGLKRTAEDEAHPEERYFVKVMEKFDISGIDEARLLGSIPTESLIYPVALISGICSLFGISFSTFYLVILFSLVILLSVYIITKSLYTILGNKTAAAGVLFCICMLNSDNIVFFNSLYSGGMTVTSFVLLIAVFLRALTNEKRKGLCNILPVFAVMYLFLTSNESMSLLILPLLPFAIYLIYKNRPMPEKEVSFFIISGSVMIGLLFMCLHFAGKNEQFNSKMNLYAASFNGAFMAAEDKEEALSYFGLSPEYMQDIGKSYYLEEAQYVTAPYSQEAEALLYDKISYGKLSGYYLSHPQTFIRLLDITLQNSGSVNRDKYKYAELPPDTTMETVERLGYYPLIRSFIMPTSAGSFMVVCILSLLTLGILLLVRKREKQDAGICYLLLTMMLLCIGRLFITVFIYGSFDITSHLFSYMIMADGMFISLCTLAVCAVKRLLAYLNREEEQKSMESYRIADNDPFHFLYLQLIKAKERFAECILSDARYTTIFMGGLAVIIMAMVFFFPERIGAYNNGDFGRMMDAMGLYYTDYDLLHQEEQYVTKVIETYVWLDNFDWSSVTSFNPTLSQVFLAFFIRVTAGAMGFGYSTVYATVIYMILMGASFFALVWGLYKLLGRKAAGLSALLIVVLFGSYNLGWFNSLFGEATEMAGLLMVMGVSLIIIAKEKGNVRWYWWLILLASIRFFIGSKAQVTPEIIVLAPWTLSLAFYHRPPQKTKWMMQIAFVGIMTVMTARSALIIYQKNNEISSQDTIYAAIFAGILVIADDPAAALTELGLDPSLAADAGKHQYLDKSEYFCPPRSEKAEEMVYSQIDAMGILKWYLLHPAKLWAVLDYTAQESAALMPDYFLYVGEKTTQEHRVVSKFNLWGSIRGSITPDAFWQYIVIYGALIVLCVVKMKSKKTEGPKRMLAAFYIVIILTGAMQFPLTVIGNGFIDNTKQLYLFRLVHDIVITTAVFGAGVYLTGKMKQSKAVSNKTIANLFQKRPKAWSFLK